MPASESKEVARANELLLKVFEPPAKEPEKSDNDAQQQASEESEWDSKLQLT